MLRHRAPYGGDHFAQVRARYVPALQLLDDYQLLPFVGAHRERRATPRTQGCVALFHRLFYVLRVMVASPNNDELFEPARYEQLPVVQKPQVTGPQKGPLARPRQVHPKSVLRLLALAPVPLGDARARHPDLSYTIGRAPGQRARVDHNNLLVRQGPPAAHQLAGALLRGGGRDYPVALEFRSFDGEYDGRSRLQTAGDEQGRLREPVGGGERLPAKAAGRKGRHKPLQDLLSNGLGTGNSHLPAAKVEGRALSEGGSANTEIVGKVRRNTGGGPETGDSLQPLKGLLQKGDRRHERDRKPGVERLQHPPDKPHVMVGGQPGHPLAVRGVIKSVIDHGQVVQEVAVG